MAIGFVYFVFLPSIVTTPLAGRAAHRFGTRRTMWGGLAVAAVGLPLLLVPNLIAVMAGLVLVGVGTFFAQATATGFVSRAATVDRGSASGIYLACYFFGGMVGSAVLGQLFDRFGWTACVAGIGLSLGTAGLIATRLRKQQPGAGLQGYSGIVGLEPLALSRRRPRGIAGAHRIHRASIFQRRRGGR